MQVASNSADSIAHHFLSNSDAARSITAPRRTSKDWNPASFKSWTPFPFSVLVTWFKRSRFRAALITDLAERPHYLSDIGISEQDARIEVTRFFWEPILLKKPALAKQTTLSG